MREDLGAPAFREITTRHPAREALVFHFAPAGIALEAARLFGLG